MPVNFLVYPKLITCLLEGHLGGYGLSILNVVVTVGQAIDTLRVNEANIDIFQWGVKAKLPKISIVTSKSDLETRLRMLARVCNIIYCESVAKPIMYIIDFVIGTGFLDYAYLEPADWTKFVDKGLGIILAEARQSYEDVDVGTCLLDLAHEWGDIGNKELMMLAASAAARGFSKSSVSLNPDGGLGNDNKKQYVSRLPEFVKNILPKGKHVCFDFLIGKCGNASIGPCPKAPSRIHKKIEFDAKVREWLLSRASA